MSISAALALFAFAPSVAWAAQTSGRADIRVRATNEITGRQEEISLYHKMHAVIIGIDSYSRLPPDQQLRYAVSDARGIAEVLRRRYAFTSIEEIYNEEATSASIRSVLLDKLGSTVGEDDAVFIFFAGHGQTIGGPDNSVGYLVPSDGSLDPDKISRNISMNEIRLNVSRIVKARHIFYIIDACYGGLMLRAGLPPRAATRLEQIRGLAREPAREFLAAGNDRQTVLDGGYGGHSVFTGNVIRRLEETSDFITAFELATWVKERTSNAAAERGHEQTPIFGQLDNEHSAYNGNFVFVVKAGAEVAAVNAETFEEGAGSSRISPVPSQTNRAPIRAGMDRRSPTLRLDQTPDRSVEKRITISGAVSDDQPGVELLADNTLIPLDTQGRFSVRYTLDEGVNTLTLIARDATGKESIKSLNVSWEAPAEVVTASGRPAEPAVGVPPGFSVVGSSREPTTGLPRRIRHDATGYELILVKTSSFTMGSPDMAAGFVSGRRPSEPDQTGGSAWDEVPEHAVEVGSFWMGVTEVSNAQFRKFNPGHASAKLRGRGLDGDDHPVVRITWEEAVQFCGWAGLRLPTEAEWELAAAGTDRRMYPWGKNFNGRIVNCRDQVGRASAPGLLNVGDAVTKSVGSYPEGASPYDCLDMAGNAAEWCEDWFDPQWYSRSAGGASRGPDRGTLRVVRGGSWNSTYWDLRCADRKAASPTTASEEIGFRAALSPLLP